MKNVIRKLIPKLVRILLKEYYNKIHFNKIPQINCNPDNLIKINREEIVKLLNSSESELSWEVDKMQLKSFQFSELSGGINPGDQRALYYLLKYFNPSNILEIGTHLGYSTITCAIALKDAQACGNITTVDILDVNDAIITPWVNYNSKYSPQEMVRMINFEDFVNFIIEPSLSFMKKCNDKFDFIFLDGDHSPQTVYQELPLALKLLTSDGIILLHDYFPDGKPMWGNTPPVKGPYLAIKRLLDEKQALRVVPLGKLPWQTKFNTNITSLAIVTRIT